MLFFSITFVDLHIHLCTCITITRYRKMHYTVYIHVYVSSNKIWRIFCTKTSLFTLCSYKFYPIRSFYFFKIQFLNDNLIKRKKNPEAWLVLSLHAARTWVLLSNKEQNVGPSVHALRLRRTLAIQQDCDPKHAGKSTCKRPKKRFWPKSGLKSEALCRKTLQGGWFLHFILFHCKED